MTTGASLRVFEEALDVRARQGDAGRRVRIGEDDGAAAVEIIGHIDPHRGVERDRLVSQAEKPAPDRVEAVGDIRKDHGRRLLQEGRERVRQHFVRAVADENLIGTRLVNAGDGFAQAGRSRVRVQPKPVAGGGSNGLDRFRRRAERILVGVEFHKARDLRLLAGDIGREIAGELRPEAIHGT